MRKVKITRRQKEFVDKMLEKDGTFAFNNFMSLKPETSTPLDMMRYEDVSLVFNGWYEVVSTYNVGDYLFNEDNETYYKITNVKNGEVKINPLGNIMSMTIEGNDTKFIKVLEKWKIMLLDIGRFNPELKIGDVVMTNSGDIFIYYANTMEKIYDLLSNDQVMAFYPLEHRIRLS